MAELNLLSQAALDLAGAATSKPALRRLDLVHHLPRLLEDLVLLQMALETLLHDVDRWAWVVRLICRWKRRSPSTFCRRRRECSCSSIVITRSSLRGEVVQWFADIATLCGFWIVFKSDFLSDNCLFSHPSGFQVRSTLIEALQIACSPVFK